MKHLHKFLLLGTIALLYACVPSSRLDRLLTNHPELIIPDTVVISDTIAIPTAVAETLLYLEKITTPVILNRDRLEVEIRKQHDTLYVKGKCKPDTLYRTRQIPVEKIKWMKPNRTDQLLSKIPWVAGMIMALAFVFIMILRGRR